MKACHRQSGFTLIELMVVIAIALLIMGWGIPNMLNTLEKQGINKAVTDLMEGCKQARAYAILSGESAELVIAADTGAITIRKASGPRLLRGTERGFVPPPDGNTAPPTRGSQKRVEKLKSFNRALEEQVAVEMLDVNFIDQTQYPDGIVRFYPNGTSDEFTIVIRVDAEWRKVGLDPITGIASVEDLKDYR